MVGTQHQQISVFVPTEPSMISIRTQGGTTVQKSINANRIQCVDGDTHNVVFEFCLGLPAFGCGGYPGGDGGGGGGGCCGMGRCSQVQEVV